MTAGDSGIGKATAVALARAGCDVGLTWNTDEAGAKETANEIGALGRGAEIRHLDLTQLPGAADVVDDLAAALGGLDVFVNNAGTGTSSPFLEQTFEEWKEVLDVDLNGAFLCAQRAARIMVANRTPGSPTHRRIVNVTSVHEHTPKEGSAAYCAAKGGLGLLTKVMALELAEHGITVNAVAPGEIATPMTGNEDVDPATVSRPGIPAGRPGDAWEVAHVIVHLTSPEASYTTGHSYVVDGGLMLMPAMANVIAKPGSDGSD